MKRTFLLFCLIAASLLLIYASGAVDISGADLFYRSGFYLNGNVLVQAVDTYMEYAICALFAAAAGLWLSQRIRLPEFINRKFGALMQKFPVSNRQMLFLSVCFFGWCIAMPYAFKMFFHRARPYQTNIFGGDCLFSGAFVKSVCPAGDSFISGHTSFAMWLLAPALILPPRFRRAGIAVAIFIALSVASCRLSGGYHYFTDVYFAMLLCGAGICFTYRRLFATPEAAGLLKK